MGNFMGRDCPLCSETQSWVKFIRTWGTCVIIYFVNYTPVGLGCSLITESSTQVPIILKLGLEDVDFFNFVYAAKNITIPLPIHTLLLNRES